MRQTQKMPGWIVVHPPDEVGAEGWLTVGDLGCRIESMIFGIGIPGGSQLPL